MNILFTCLLVIHAAIHFLGYTGKQEVPDHAKNRAKLIRLLWFSTVVIFLVSAIGLNLQVAYWWILCGMGIIVSQCLIIISWKKAKYGTIINAILLLFVIISHTTFSFKNKYTREVASELQKHQRLASLTENRMSGLPEKVKKYLRLCAVKDGPYMYNFSAHFQGRIRKKGGDWMELSSEQFNFMEPAKRLFFMNATMKHLPVAGFHRFSNEGTSMDIRLFSLIRVEEQHGREMAMAETVTFFNDICCLAPEGLIDQRINWHYIDGDTVAASFENLGISISAKLVFSAHGELINFISDDRYALMEDGSMKKLRWSTPLKNYKKIGYRYLATEAQTIYQYPDGPFVYGEFNLVDARINRKTIP